MSALPIGDLRGPQFAVGACVNGKRGREMVYRCSWGLLDAVACDGRKFREIARSMG